eukprot:TRINITY_DN16363_c0_g1_i1.p2 TRINITY_DN16363_c0_g1~~TRINITY_DN16363_c0_g1_i1.p2  ORF type:complete len:103 (-),score=2.58 TRINITY_DN16363_c0_g1_i1:10-318(-)
MKFNRKYIRDRQISPKFLSSNKKLNVEKYKHALYFPQLSPSFLSPSFFENNVDVRTVREDWCHQQDWVSARRGLLWAPMYSCLLYTSPSPRDGLLSRMPSSA